MVRQACEAAGIPPASGFGSRYRCQIKAARFYSKAPSNPAGCKPYGTTAQHPAIEGKSELSFLVIAGPMRVKIQVTNVEVPFPVVLPSGSSGEDGSSVIRRKVDDGDPCALIVLDSPDAYLEDAAGDHDVRRDLNEGRWDDKCDSTLPFVESAVPCRG